MTAKLTDVQLSILRMFGENTYCIEIKPSHDRTVLEIAGLLKWVPPPAWHSNNSYSITDAGRRAIARARTQQHGAKE
jgi:hypothetical protein